MTKLIDTLGMVHLIVVTAIIQKYNLPEDEVYELAQRVGLDATEDLMKDFYETDYKGPKQS